MQLHSIVPWRFPYKSPTFALKAIWGELPLVLACIAWCKRKCTNSCLCIPLCLHTLKFGVFSHQVKIVATLHSPRLESLKVQKLLWQHVNVYSTSNTAKKPSFLAGCCYSYVKWICYLYCVLKKNASQMKATNWKRRL